MASAMSGIQLLPWYPALSPEAKIWIERVAATGTHRFVNWLGDTDAPIDLATAGLGAAPRAAAHAVTLGQTVELIQTAVSAAERFTLTLVEPDEEAWFLQLTARFGREIAFSAAVVYARVAEAQGARLARATSDLVEALLGGRTPAAIGELATRVGVDASAPVVVGAWSPPQGVSAGIGSVERAGRKLDRGVVTAVHEGIVIAIWPIRTREDPLTIARKLFGSKSLAVVAGPAESFGYAREDLRRALGGIAALPARAELSGPVAARDLITERALLGEVAARDELIARCYVPLRDAQTGLLETVEVMINNQGVLEKAARAIPVHVNTLRYRLDRILELTGFDLRDSRGALAIYIGVSLGKINQATSAAGH